MIYDTRSWAYKSFLAVGGQKPAQGQRKDKTKVSGRTAPGRHARATDRQRTDSAVDACPPAGGGGGRGEVGGQEAGLCVRPELEPNARGG